MSEIPKLKRKELKGLPDDKLNELERPALECMLKYFAGENKIPIAMVQRAGWILDEHIKRKSKAVRDKTRRFKAGLSSKDKNKMIKDLMKELT